MSPFLLTDDIHSEDLDPEDLQPFPTLKRCLETVDEHTGFNIEIKYPQMMKVYVIFIILLCNLVSIAQQ